MKKIVLLSGVMALAMNVDAVRVTSVPPGELRDFTYRVSGGMNPFEQAYYCLHVDENGIRSLTVKGESPGERISFEVADSVFIRVADMIKTDKLYLAESFYRSKMIVHDAPSETMSAYFKVPGERTIYTIGTSGDIPREYKTSISRICDYLQSLVGDRKAVGHLHRYIGNDMPAASLFSNGKNISFNPGNGNFIDLYSAMAADGLINDNPQQHSASWRHSIYRDNDGVEYLYVEYNSLSRYADVFPQSDKAPKSPMIPLIQGMYTDPDGKVYVFTREGTLKHNYNDVKASPVTIKATEGGNLWLMTFEGKTYKFLLTDDGINLYKVSKNAKTKRTTYASEPLCLKMDVSENNEAKIPGRWHVAAMYPLSIATLELLPRNVLNIMTYEMEARKGSRIDYKVLQPYFASKSWYKKDSLDRNNFPLSDVENLNKRLIEAQTALTYKGKVPQTYCYEGDEGIDDNK